VLTLCISLAKLFFKALSIATGSFAYKDWKIAHIEATYFQEREQTAYVMNY